MELLVFILPLIAGSAIIVALFPEYCRSGAGLILTGSIGAGIGIGITSATAFLWLAWFDHPGGGYLTAELGLSILLVLLAIYRFRKAKKTIEPDQAASYRAADSQVGWLKKIFLFLLIAFVASFILKPILNVRTEHTMPGRYGIIVLDGYFWAAVIGPMRLLT